MKLGCALVCVFLLPVAGQNDRRSPLAEPAISPDHSEISFVSGGDIWTVPAAGGVARLLISHPATESRPVYSPDGTRLAFTSTRSGNGDVYVLNLSSGDLKRLTFHEGPERADAWSPDGKFIYFSSTISDIAGMNDIFRVASEGGTPMQYSGDRYASEYFAAPNPAEPGSLALTAKGVVATQWWRNGHSHIDESEIWIRRDVNPAKYERVSTGGAKEAWPMWSANGKQLWFMSDRSGAENIWTKQIGGGPARQATKFASGRVLWPSISADGKSIVFERDFGVWNLDTASGKAAQVPIQLRGSPAGPGVARTPMTTGFRDLALSPDGKKIVFTARGDVFAASAKDGGIATRLTATAALESNPTWAPDNRRVAYNSDRDGVQHIFLHDLRDYSEKQLTKSPEIDSAPYWSPDGKRLAFFRGGQRLMVMDAESGSERELAKGFFSLPPVEPARPIVWSPDNKWIAWTVPGTRSFRNVMVAPADGGTPITASYLPNTGGNTVSWSPDGKYILFDTGQRTEAGRIARIDLIPRTPRFREDQFRDLFRDDPSRPQQPAPTQPAVPETTGSTPSLPVPAKTEPPPDKNVRVVAEGIRQRLTLLPVGVDVQAHTISPDGKILLIAGSAAGQTSLWTYSLDELSREPAVSRQLTSTPGSKTDFWFTPDNKEIYYLETGRIQSMAIETRVAKPVSVTAEVDTDFAKDKEEVFRQTWSYLNDHFYDDKFHGVDWNSQKQRTAPYVEGSKTPDELRRVLSLMIGELNASHTGIGGPVNPTLRTGTLGLRFNRDEYETSGRLKITEVIRLSPADVSGVKPGQYLVAVDGTKITGRTNLDEILEHKAGRRVTLTVAADANDTGKQELAVSPVTGLQEKALLYRHWVENSREYVHKASGGRLGYVHMFDMSANSLDQLYIDLDSENVGRAGVVVDVRNNNGGFVNVYALDVLSRTPFINMTSRGEPTVPARSLLGQRSLERPTILVVNQHSLSDAEDFTEGYRTMKLGKVVGEKTAGWIIYTWNTELIDGSALRLPRVRVTGLDGQNMERNPRPVDIPVERPIGESYTGRDSQLDVAVRELLKNIGPGNPLAPGAAPSGTN